MTSFCGTADSWVAICDTAVDWGATGDFWSGIGTTAGAVAVVVATFKAKNALDDWKAQKLSERKIEQAERILEAAYEARDALAYVRQANLPELEKEKAHAELIKRSAMPFSEVSIQLRMASQARLMRLDSVQQKAEKLLNCRPMAKAFFNDALYNAITLLHDQFVQLRFHLDANRKVEAGPPPGALGSVAFNVLGDHRKKLSDETRGSIKAIEAECLPVLRDEPGPKSKWWQVRRAYAKG